MVSLGLLVEHAGDVIGAKLFFSVVQVYPLPCPFFLTSALWGDPAGVSHGGVDAGHVILDLGVLFPVPPLLL